MMFGTVKPFPKEQLKQMYQSLDNYRLLCEKSADAAIAKGYILPEDRAYMVDSCVRIAEERGL